QMCGSVAPQQIHQVVARESPPRLDGETNQQREVLARAEADLLTRRCEQQERRAERGKVQVRRQKDGSPCFGMGLLDARINVLSTRSESAGKYGLTGLAGPGSTRERAGQRSSTSRTLRARLSIVNGFCRWAIPASSTPWRTTASSVYPDT